MWPKTEKQESLFKKAQKIARHISSTSSKHDRDGSFPHEHFDFMRDIGYLASAVPEKYGGPGYGLTDIVLAQFEIGTGDGSTALSVGMHHMVIGTEAIAERWPDQIRQKVFQEIVSKGVLLNNIASEPDLGSPQGGGRPSTELVPDKNGGWYLDGRKTWSTLAPELTYAITFAAVEDGTGDTARVLQNMSADGISIEETWDSMSMRSTGSHDIIFKKVKVKDADFLFRSNPNHPIKDPIGGAAWFPLMTSAANLGVANAARNYALEFAKDRKPTGATGTISKIPYVREQIGRLESKLIKAKRNLFSFAEDWENYPEQREDILTEIGVVKTSSIDAAIEITDLAIKVVGGVGLEKSRPLERYFRDVRSGLFNPPIEARALEQLASSILD